MNARWLALLAAAAACGAVFVDSLTVGRFKSGYLDALVRARSPRVLDGPDDPLVFVALDVDSLSRLAVSQRRAVLARMIDRIAEGKPRAIALDLQFLSPDVGTSSAKETLDELAFRVREAPSWIKQEIALLRGERDADARLIASLSRAPVVGTFYTGPSASAAPPIEALGRALDAQDCEKLPEKTTATVDLPEFVAAFRDRGNVDVPYDVDNIAREYSLVTRIGGAVRPSFAVAAASRYLGEEAMLECKKDSIQAMSVGTNVLEAHYDGRVRIDYRGTLEAAFPNRVSAGAVVAGTAPPERFREKLVFIGYESPFDDVLYSPVGRINGIALHGMVAHSILTNHWLRRSFGAEFGEALLALVLAFGAVLAVFSGWNPRLSFAVPAALALPLIAHFASLWLAEHDRLVDLLSPTLAGSVGLIAGGMVRWREERIRRQTMERELSPFFSPEVLRIALDDPKLLEPKRREVTILFSDIRGFTRAAESLAPEALVRMLGLYLERMTAVVLENGGQVDKYIGDAVMACFGAPTEDPRHAHSAANAALAMKNEVSRLQDEWEKSGLPRLGVGIGVNTGTALVGKMGSPRKLEYTSIGDDVNFASRAEGLTKSYGAGIIVGQATAERVRNEFMLRDLGPVKVEGKAKAVRIYELLDRKGAEPEWVATFHRGLAAFLARDWNAAEKSFRAAISARGEDGPSRSFLDEIDRLRTSPPPPDWDGSLSRHK